MRIFVTGASGWIGSAVVPELIRAGHQVLGLARSDASATAVAGLGAEVLRGDLDDTGVLRAGTLDSDGVIHLAFVVPSVSEAATRTDARAIETFVTGLAGSGKPLVISGATLVTPGRPATERDELIAAGPIAARITNMQAALAAAARGVRSCLVMLPRSVHGQGERHGFVPQLIAAARAKGVSGYIGDGTSRWPAVHVLDAASLYRLAIEQAPAGAVLNAVGDQGVPVREIAEAIGRHLNLPARSLPAGESAACWCTSSAPTCPPPAPSPRNSWAGTPPTLASSRTSNRATTSSDRPGTTGETTTGPCERGANLSRPA